MAHLKTGENAAWTLGGQLPAFFVKGAFWVPLGLCMAVAWTPDPGIVTSGLSGPLAHSLAFTYLTVALIVAHYQVQDGQTTDRYRHEVVTPSEYLTTLLAAMLWMFAFGVLIEVVQLLFVAGRGGDFVDLIWDATGIATGCAIYAGWRRFRPLG